MFIGKAPFPLFVHITKSKLLFATHNTSGNGYSKMNFNCSSQLFTKESKTVTNNKSSTEKNVPKEKIVIKNTNKFNKVDSVVISNACSHKVKRYLHPWVFKDDITAINHQNRDKKKKEEKYEEKGEIITENEYGIVQVFSENKQFIGNAFYNGNSEISLRFFTFKNEKFLSNFKHLPTKEFWRNKLQNAIKKRENINNVDEKNKTTAYRLINSESDFFPSLIVDKYNDAIIIQTLTQTTSEKTFKNFIINLLKEELSPNLIIERNDSPIRALERLPSIKTTHFYSPSPSIQVENEGKKEKDYLTKVFQNGIQFNVSLLNGQKTGLFLDQRENYFAARNYSKIFKGKGKALDCFTYHGGFALNISSSFEKVDAIDRSESSISIAQENAKLNNISNINFYTADVFDELRKLYSKGEEYEMVILDPPAFTKSKENITSAIRGYKDINLWALKLLKHEGILVTCSCSYHISDSALLNLINEVARESHICLEILERRQQSSDHPVLSSVPESHYLKCFVFRVHKMQHM